MGKVLQFDLGRTTVRKMPCPICGNQSFERIRVDAEAARLHGHMLKCTCCKVFFNEPYAAVSAGDGAAPTAFKAFARRAPGRDDQEAGVQAGSVTRRPRGA
jgi:hypothetical protein